MKVDAPQGCVVAPLGASGVLRFWSKRVCFADVPRDVQTRSFEV